MWNDFLIQQRAIFDEIYNAFPPEHETYEPVLIRRPHRLCTRVEPGKSLDTRTILYVCEIVEPCGPTKHLREVLRPTTRFREASQAATAEAWVYHAIVYLYNHLLESGSESGILITGQAMVFLQVKLDDPGTLYYHISEPCHDIAEACEEAAAFLSVVGQCVAFTMMALQTRKLKSRQPLQEIRLQMHKTLPKWGQPSGSPLEGAPPGLSPPEDAINASARYSSSTEEMNTERQSDQTEPGTKLNELSGLNRGTEYRAQDWPYCTQRCLLGLVRGELLDSKCPNVMLHCQGEADSHSRHPINHSDCLSLLRDQFKHSLDEGITYDGIFGSFSMLFKVTLLAYGYTFVSKGTISTLVERLKNEAKMYQQLEPIQGTHVPVFLGTIDLRTMDKSYSVYWGVDVVHMIFLSWGGRHIDPREMARLEIPMSRLVELEQAEKGVLHSDVRWRNILFNSETNGIMMINFERAHWIGKLRTSARNKVKKDKVLKFIKAVEKQRIIERKRIALAVHNQLGDERIG
ncbi:hypothetical protein E4U24_003383 [Claviceps purpurea]|nr:hypothetical protein E4U24_003383 [Claviceps purpurea]